MFSHFFPTNFARYLLTIHVILSVSVCFAYLILYLCLCILCLLRFFIIMIMIMIMIVHSIYRQGSGRMRTVCGKKTTWPRVGTICYGRCRIYPRIPTWKISTMKWMQGKYKSMKMGTCWIHAVRIFSISLEILSMVWCDCKSIQV